MISIYIYIYIYVCEGRVRTKTEIYDDKTKLSSSLGQHGEDRRNQK